MGLTLSSGGRLILASGSPRRKELLTKMGLEFEVIKSTVDESKIPADHPRTFALRAAFLKAQNVAGQCQEGDLVLASDTVVTHNSIIYGKPADEKEARVILRALSGRTHQVITGVALSVVGKPEVNLDSDTTEVSFLNVSDAQIDAYIETGSPMDKAGAYGIQDLNRDFIAGIQGSYYNVMGLPCNIVANMLENYLENPRGLTIPTAPDVLA